jgi:hypothetical protein
MQPFPEYHKVKEDKLSISFTCQNYGWNFSTTVHQVTMLYSRKNDVKQETHFESIFHGFRILTGSIGGCPSWCPA